MLQSHPLWTFLIEIHKNWDQPVFPQRGPVPGDRELAWPCTICMECLEGAFCRFLRYVDAPEWFGVVVPLPERIDRVQFLLRGIPEHLVHSWGLLALVFRHPSNSTSLAT